MRGTDSRLLSATKSYTNMRSSWSQKDLEHRTVRDPAYERSGAKYIVRR
jgi:hypothetical protein